MRIILADDGRRWAVVFLDLDDGAPTLGVRYFGTREGAEDYVARAASRSPA